MLRRFATFLLFAAALAAPSVLTAQPLSLPADELTSGVPVVGVAGRSFLTYYGISVAAPSRLMFDLTGGTDPQIFLAKDRLPTLTDWDIRVGFGFPALNYQVATEPGEWYIGVRDVNLDIPLPAEPFTLTATLQDDATSPPLGFDLTGGARRETSSASGQLQYFTVELPGRRSVVDFATGERFGSGNANLYVVANLYPRIAANGNVVDYSVVASAPGNVDRLRFVAPPLGSLVAALHGSADPGYENVFISAVTTQFDLLELENNRDAKVSGSSPMHFAISVPPGQIRLTIQTSGGTGASHLSAKLDSPILASSIYPDLTADFVGSDDPRKPNDAQIVIPNPAAGVYYFLLEPEDAAGFTNVQVRARFRGSL